jgi:ribosome-associated toxin RatA of RatAB toxin-antitoxin module
MHRLQPLRALAAVVLAAALTSGAAAPAERGAGTVPLRVAGTEGMRTEPIPIPGSDLVRGRTTLVIHAPLAKVRAVVRDFTRYPEFMPHFRACRILGRSPSGGRDVYMEVVALHGAMKMWARLDARKPVTADGLETHDLRFMEGNVRDFTATWRLRALEAGRTELSLEVFLRPNVPLPARLLNDENLDGSAKGAAAIRARVER